MTTKIITLFTDKDIKFELLHAGMSATSTDSHVLPLELGTSLGSDRFGLIPILTEFLQGDSNQYDKLLQTLEEIMQWGRDAVDGLFQLNWSYMVYAGTHMCNLRMSYRPDLKIHMTLKPDGAKAVGGIVSQELASTGDAARMLFNFRTLCPADTPSDPKDFVFAIIKPASVARGDTAAIIDHLRAQQFHVYWQKALVLDATQIADLQATDAIETTGLTPGELCVGLWMRYRGGQFTKMTFVAGLHRHGANCQMETLRYRYGGYRFGSDLPDEQDDVVFHTRSAEQSVLCSDIVNRDTTQPEYEAIGTKPPETDIIVWDAQCRSRTEIMPQAALRARLHYRQTLCQDPFLISAIDSRRGNLNQFLGLIKSILRDYLYIVPDLHEIEVRFAMPSMSGVMLRFVTVWYTAYRDEVRVNELSMQIEHATTDGTRAVFMPRVVVSQVEAYTALCSFAP